MNQPLKPTKYDKFVTFIITLIAKDTGAAAALKRADNANLEYQSWEYLARFVELDKDYLRLPYATIAAALAKAKVERNGNACIGEAIAHCYADGSNNEQAKAKLRRLLACDSVEEVCRVLRPLLSLIHAKADIQLDYVALLKELIWFNEDNQRTKAYWARKFYRAALIEEAAL